ncbi:MAG: aminotransferase class I/II-fold pyridoxal phosphate-dependent enzyme [Candidatus Parcubacteria bacterium]|nr:aminotransferase class I/II-fold pyridoxal phosphate-dependent enzyme [Candidatus Parcubacteria bacterium]
MINLKFGDIKEKLPQQILDRFCDEVFKDVTLYPQNYDILISRLAQKLKVRPENIVLINGVDEGIELISRVFGQDILIFSPTYYEFLDAPKRNYLKFDTINCFDGKKYTLKYKETDVENRSLIFLCNPNNPFGLLTKQEVTELAGKTNGIVAVDETYIDFNGETVLNEFEKIPNILVLRSFSKGYSLAGLRIGYIVGAEKQIEKIVKRKLICNVTSVSVNAAMIVLEEEKYFMSLVDKIKKMKDDFEDFLKSKGFNVIHTHTNNIIIKFPSTLEANAFYNFLKINEVIINQGDGISTCGLDDTFIRFACGTETQMNEVTKIVEKFKLQTT